jgi:hypothetical protein
LGENSVPFAFGIQPLADNFPTQAIREFFSGVQGICCAHETRYRRPQKVALLKTDAAAAYRGRLATFPNRTLGPVAQYRQKNLPPIERSPH